MKFSVIMGYMPIRFGFQTALFLGHRKKMFLFWNQIKMFECKANVRKCVQYKSGWRLKTVSQSACVSFIGLLLYSCD